MLKIQKLGILNLCCSLCIFKVTNLGVGERGRGMSGWKFLPETKKMTVKLPGVQSVN